MSTEEVDAYLAGLDEPKRSTLEALRASILRAQPDAEQCISYGVPGFRVDGVVVAGFAAAKNHLSYFPHSGSVLNRLGSELAGFDWSKGTLRFPTDRPLADELVERLLSVRISMISS